MAKPARKGKAASKAPAQKPKGQVGGAREGAGRKPFMTPALMAEYVERLENGELHTAICNLPHMPDGATIWRTQERDAEFARQCTRAREIAMWLENDELVEQERAVKAGTLSPEQHRAIAQTKTWRMKCLSKMVFGDKTMTELTGKDGGPLEFANLTDDQRKARIAELLAKRQT